jgi:hypothetical protein
VVDICSGVSKETTTYVLRIIGSSSSAYRSSWEERNVSLTWESWKKCDYSELKGGGGWGGRIGLV